MFADAIKCTHNGTGGASTITLAAVTGFPQPTDVFGTSGTINVLYEAAEWTDSTQTVLSKYESGIGSLVLSTNVLTRSVVLKSWTSGGSYNAKNASALTFGNTAANFSLLLGAQTANMIGGILAMPASVSGFTSDVWQPFNTRVTYDSALGTFTTTNGSRLFVPVDFIYAKPITQVAVEVTTGVASGAVRVGLYDVDQATGLAGNLLTEFTSAAQIDATTTGFRSVTMATPFWAPPGKYLQCFQSNSSTIVLRRLTHSGHSLLSTASGGGRDILMYDKSATYGALPATGDVTASTTYSRSGGGQVAGFYK